MTGRELELSLLARIQPYIWFMGMLLFSVSNHLTGLQGMPRRIYTFEYGGSEAAAQWAAGTGISALGGVFLFISAACYIAVMFGTGLAGKKVEPEAIEFSEALEGPNDKAPILDNLKIWVVIAVVLVIAAYGWPIAEHLMTPRFGSPGFSPF